MKQANPPKNGISLFANVHQRCVLYQRTGLVGIYCHAPNGLKLVQLLVTVEPSKMIQRANRPYQVVLN
jgi:hypothetical protein